MDITHFKSGVFKKQCGYTRFVPEPVNQGRVPGDTGLDHLLSSTERK